MAKFRHAIGTLAVLALTSLEAKLLLAELNLCYRLQKKKEKKTLQSKCKILSGAEHLVIPPKSMEKGLVPQPVF